MKKLFYLFLGVGLLAASCAKEDSSDVNQDKIYCDYELFYNQNEDKTHAVARFRFGGPTGTLLELSDSTGAGVTFNGDAMAYNGWYGGHHVEYAGNVTTGTFVYTNTDGTVFTNSVPAGDTIAFPVGFDTINKSAAQTLEWVGSQLAADQKVSVFIGSWTWGEDALFYTEADGAYDIVMGVTQMQNLAVGSATFYMDRATGLAVTEGTSEGGRIRYKYRCTNVAGTVIE